MLVTVLVGAKRAKFTINEELLTSHSDFFRAALTGRFKEAESKSITLKDDDIRIFKFFVHWLRHQRFPDKHDAEPLYKKWTSSVDGETMTDNLIRLYVLADKYQVLELKIKIMTMLFNHVFDGDCDVFPDDLIVQFAYKNLPPNSPLCQFLVDVYCYWSTCSTWSDFADCEWPPAFMTGVLCQYTDFALGDRGRDDFTTPCDYHGHQSCEERIVCQVEQQRDEEAGVFDY